MIWTYVIIAAILLIAELVYFKIADHFNIIDKPNERSSHSTIVLRGGGVIFALSMIVWAVLMVVQGNAKCFGDRGTGYCLAHKSGINEGLFQCYQDKKWQLRAARGSFLKISSFI